MIGITICSYKTQEEASLFGLTSSLLPSPGRLDQMHCVIGICSIIIKVCTKGSKSDMPQTTELNLLYIFRSNPDGTLDIFLQLLIGIMAIHTYSPRSCNPTSPLETQLKS